MLLKLFAPLNTRSKLPGVAQPRAVSASRLTNVAEPATPSGLPLILSKSLCTFEEEMDRVASDFEGQWIYARLGGVGTRDCRGVLRAANLAGLNPLDELRLSNDGASLLHDKGILVTTKEGFEVGDLERHVGQDVMRRSAGTRFACFLCSIEVASPNDLPRVKVAIMDW